MASITYIGPKDEFFSHFVTRCNEVKHTVTHLPFSTDDLKTEQLVHSDITIFDISGFENISFDFLKDIINKPVHPSVIIVTNAVEASQARDAIEIGAWDYIERESVDQLLSSIDSALKSQLKRPRRRLHDHLKSKTLEEIVGRSGPMKVCLELTAQAAASDAHVLIHGETGTGKELFARAIHQNSERAGGSFVVVDCASLPENLVEDTLFGHERGAFTGADRARNGLISQADKGTLFLDEVGELPLATQGSFLRLLEEQTYRQVGGQKLHTSDFRLVSATNRDLDELVEKKLFRDDLLYRLKSFTITIPSLRERKEDIPDLIEHHIAYLHEYYDMAEKSVSPDFYDILRRYEWPGNVRELFNAIERALITADTQSIDILFPQHLPTYIRVDALEETEIAVTKESPEKEVGSLIREPLPTFKEMRGEIIDRLEREYLNRLTEATHGDIREASRISGLSRSRLYALLKKHGMT